MMNYKDGIKTLFENLRNLTVCALLMAAGLYENKHSTGIFGLLQIDAALGWGLVAIGVLLSLANLLVGGSQLSRLGFSKAWMAVVGCFYVIASVRMVVVLTAFRIT